MVSFALLDVSDTDKTQMRTSDPMGCDDITDGMQGRLWQGIQLSVALLLVRHLAVTILLVHVQNFFCSFNNTSWLLQIVHTGILILLPSYGDFALFYFLSVGVLCVSPTSANSCHVWSRQRQRSAAGRRSAIRHLKPWSSQCVVPMPADTSGRRLNLSRLCHLQNEILFIFSVRCTVPPQFSHG